jgi:hypothetical protein
MVAKNGLRFQGTQPSDKSIFSMVMANGMHKGEMARCSWLQI